MVLDWLPSCLASPFRQFRDWISEKLTWQTLGHIGRSNIGKITILAPFVGYLIIFNPNFEALFKSTLPHSDGELAGFTTWLHDMRLYFLYFGLIFLGFGIILFSLLAPASVRQFPIESGYINEMESVKSSSLVVSRLDDVISSFLHYNRGEARSPLFSGQHPSFPSQPTIFLHDLIANILNHMPKDELPMPSSREPYGTLFQSSPHAIASGDSYISTDEVMERMFESGITAEMSYYRYFREQSVPFSKQVFFVDYVAANYSSFGARLATFLLYLIGFVFLALPTITTSILVFNAALN